MYSTTLSWLIPDSVHFSPDVVFSKVIEKVSKSVNNNNHVWMFVCKFIYLLSHSLIEQAQQAPH